MITLTEAAARHIQQLVEEDGRENVSLRIFVDKGGCSGLQYNMQIDAPQAGDQSLESCGVKFFMDADAIGFLKGSEIDFEDTLTSTGFKIRNPNAKQTCGCGTSFEPDKAD